MTAPPGLLLLTADESGIDTPSTGVRARSIDEVRRLLTDGLEPDCVLVDLHLPGTDGTDAVDALLRLDADLPIIVLGRSGDDAQVRLALHAGAHDHLERGTDLDGALARRAVRAAIDQAALTTALRASRRELHEFAHRFSHDLKSPMAVLIGALDLLAQAQPEDADSDLHDMASRAGRRLVAMVDRMVEYADSAGAGENLTSVDLDSVVAWAEEALGDDYGGVVVERSPLPHVRGNEMGLCHVFLNLIANAARFRDPARPPRVVIAAEDAAGDDGTVVVTVADNGIGVEPEHRSSVFAPGYRGPTPAAGPGLGLATVDRVVRSAGGTVTVEDGPDGVGTTIRLELPRP